MRALKQLLIPALGTLLLTQAVFAGDPPVITREEVLESLHQNEAHWLLSSERGHPLLIFDRAGLDQLHHRFSEGLAAGQPDVVAMVTKAAEIASRPAHAYMTPEEAVKKGTSKHDSEQELWQRDVGDIIVLLCIAEQAKSSPAILEKIHETVLAACRYPSWGLYGPNMDLSSGHLSRAIALAWDWYPELWSPADRQLILSVIRERANQLLAGLYGKAFWSRGYQANHNHVSVAGLAWCGVAFYQDIPEAPEWLAAARLNFQNVARYFPADGSSAEGVPYWSYAISFILQYIEGTRILTDSADLYQADFLRNAASFRLSSSTSGFAGTLPWGDAPLKDYVGPHHMLYRLANQYHDDSAGWLVRHLPFPVQGGPDVLAWTALWQSSQISGSKPATLDFHQQVGDIVTTRSGWGDGDYLLSVKSGFTNRNHSHLDAGALVLAFGGEWLLTAPGYGKGRSEIEFWDFGGKRWCFYSNATESHSTLLVNGKNQRFDKEARATVDEFFSAPLWNWTSVDLTEAYSDVKGMRRSVLHRRGDYFLVFDSVTAVDKPVTVEWLAQLASQPREEGKSLLVTGESGSLRLEMLLPDAAFTLRQPTVPKVDVPSGSIHTFAVKETGQTVRFAAFLQPGFSDITPPILKPRVVEQQEGRLHLAIDGPGWTDHIFQSDVPGPVDIDANSTAWKGVVGLAAIRTGKTGVESGMVIDSTEFDFAGISFKDEFPCDAGFQKAPDGSWILDASRDIGTKLQLPPGWTAQSIKNPDPKVFRFRLAAQGTSSQVASDWLNSLIVFRKKPPLPVRELAPQAPAPPSLILPIHAGDFIRQESGRAEVVTGRPGSIDGKSVRGFGGDDPGHSITWKFNVLNPGQYYLRIRYATSLTKVRAGILIDGAAPSSGLTGITLPGTGGWSVDTNDWKDLIISGEDGNPFPFNLSAGSHELSLVKPNGGLSLDGFQFQGTAK